MLVGINLVVALLACFTHALDTKASAMAFVMGVYIAYIDIRAYIIILLFLTGTVFVEHAIHCKKQEKIRNYRQVICNGVPAIFFMSFWLIRGKTDIGRLVYTAILTEAFSDSIASAIGNKYAKTAYSITSKKEIKKGTSGGVSVVGTVGALFGSILYGICANRIIFYKDLVDRSTRQIIIIIMIGWTGMLLDSFVGSIFQKKYYCNICKNYVDELICCGVPSMYIKRNYQILDNNGTNLMTGCIVGLISSIIFTAIL